MALHGPDRYIKVRYEALTAYPEPDMRKICAFHGIEFQDVVLSSSMCYMESANESENAARIISNSGKCHSYFMPMQIVEIENIAREILFSLGNAVTMQGEC